MHAYTYNTCMLVGICSYKHTYIHIQAEMQTRIMPRTFCIVRDFIIKHLLPTAWTFCTSTEVFYVSCNIYKHLKLTHVKKLYISWYFFLALLTWMCIHTKNANVYVCTYIKTYIRTCVRTLRATKVFYCFVDCTDRWTIIIFSFNYALVYLPCNFM